MRLPRPALPCPALPCPALPCPQAHARRALLRGARAGEAAAAGAGCSQPAAPPRLLPPPAGVGGHGRPGWASGPRATGPAPAARGRGGSARAGLQRCPGAGRHLPAGGRQWARRGHAGQLGGCSVAGADSRSCWRDMPGLHAPSHPLTAPVQVPWPHYFIGTRDSFSHHLVPVRCGGQLGGWGRSR